MFIQKSQYIIAFRPKYFVLPQCIHLVFGAFFANVAEYYGLNFCNFPITQQTECLCKSICRT